MGFSQYAINSPRRRRRRRRHLWRPRPPQQKNQLLCPRPHRPLSPLRRHRLSPLPHPPRCLLKPSNRLIFRHARRHRSRLTFPQRSRLPHPRTRRSRLHSPLRQCSRLQRPRKLRSHLSPPHQHLLVSRLPHLRRFPRCIRPSSRRHSRQCHLPPRRRRRTKSRSRSK